MHVDSPLLNVVDHCGSCYIGSGRYGADFRRVVVTNCVFYRPCGPDSTRDSRVKYIIMDIFVKPQKERPPPVSSSLHSGIEFGRSRTGEGFSGGRKKGVV